MPQMGLEVTEATVLRVLVAVGDHVRTDDPLFEVETEKATVEVVAPSGGVIEGIHAEPDQSVAVGALLATIGGGGEATTEAPTEEQDASSDEAPPIRAAPAARSMASAHGLALETVTGTGPLGRITIRDVERALEAAASTAPASSTAGKAPAEPAEVEPLSRLRATIARRMTESQLIPQYELQRDIDASHLLAQKDLHAVDGISLTDLLVQAIAEMLVRHPALARSFVAGDRPASTYRGQVDVGLAVATEQGLVVPVLRNVPGLGLRELGRERGRLVTAARARKLQPDDMAGGVITLSNLGMFGIDRFRAMLNPGESAIVAVGRTVERLVPAGRGIAVVPMLTVTVSFDHRIVDGAVGAAALAELGELLEGAMEWRP